MKTIIERGFLSLGFRLIYFNEKPNANGPDAFVQKQNQKPLSVEIKKLKIAHKNCIQVPPVEPGRKSDDLIAIVINSEYVLIEPMKDHLRCCGKSGHRQLTILSKGWSNNV